MGSDDNTGASERFLELEGALDCDADEETEDDCNRSGCGLDTVDAVGLDTNEGVVVGFVRNWCRLGFAGDRVLGWLVGEEYE